MVARLLDGKACAAHLREATAGRLAALAARGVQVRVGLLQIGADPASSSYVASLQRAFDRAGIAADLVELPADAAAAAATAQLDAWAADPAVHGVMLQLPLPAGWAAEPLIAHVPPAKDLDGVHPYNAGLLFAGRDDGFVPATALGGLLLLQREGVELAGARAVVVGRSAIVGRPMALLLLHQHATVTIAHSRTHDLPALCREADLLAVAVGRAGFVQPDWVRPGATVLDFGTNYTDGQLRGDVDPAVAEVAGALSPTPGGTGAVTTAVLLSNAVLAAERSLR